MIAASQPTQRPPDGKLLVVDASGRIRHTPRSAFSKFLSPRDLVIANDAATLPASPQGLHWPTGQPIEARLAGRRSLEVDDVRDFSAIIFGAGDFRTRAGNQRQAIVRKVSKSETRNTGGVKSVSRAD